MYVKFKYAIYVICIYFHVSDLYIGHFSNFRQKGSLCVTIHFHADLGKSTWIGFHFPLWRRLWSSLECYTNVSVVNVNASVI